MCLIFVARECHPRYALIVSAKRDEFYARETAPAAFWDDAPAVLAGRDLAAGGTWLGITRDGRFAAVTNFRSPEPRRDDAPSRGRLVVDFLTGVQSAPAYAESLQAAAHSYNGFGLIVADRRDMCFYSNRGGGVSAMPPGLYGLSNHLLDTPWPKVERGKAAIAAILERQRVEPEALLELMYDGNTASDDALPHTGVARGFERALSALFVRTPDYGTRSTTVVLVETTGRVRFVERSYAPGGECGATVARSFVISADHRRAR